MTFSRTAPTAKTAVQPGGIMAANSLTPNIPRLEMASRGVGPFEIVDGSDGARFFVSTSPSPGEPASAPLPLPLGKGRAPPEFPPGKGGIVGGWPSPPAGGEGWRVEKPPGRPGEGGAGAGISPGSAGDATI